MLAAGLIAAGGRLPSAQELPPPKKLAAPPPSSPAAPRARGAAVPAPPSQLIVSTDIDARIRVDGDREVAMRAEDVKALAVTPGDHLLTLVSSDGALRKQLTVRVAPAQRAIVQVTAAGELEEARSERADADRERRNADAVTERASRYARPSWIDLPGGDVAVGCAPADTHCLADERPPRVVRVGPFQMMATEVTVAAFDAYAQRSRTPMPAQPAWSTRQDMPVVNLTWTAARDYCASAGGRLPTEAEWELAARADGGGVYPWGDTFTAGAANVNGQAHGHDWTAAAPVASFAATHAGIFDLIGNVWEWSADDIAGVPLIKGGGFSSPAAVARVSVRGRLARTSADETVGCRCVKASR